MADQLAETLKPAAWASREILEDLRYFGNMFARKWWLIAFAVVTCLTLAVIYLAQADRIYQATARVLVLQQGTRPLNFANNDPTRAAEGSDDLISTHAVVISSPLVVGRAVEMVGLAKLPSLAKAESPVTAAILRLKVNRPDRTAKILQIQYNAGSRAEAVAMAEAITLSYKRFLEDSYQRNSSEVITLITKARNELSRELEDLERKYREFHQNNPMVMSNESGHSFISRRLDQWDRSANEISIKAIQLKAQLELGRRLAVEGMGIKAVAHAMSQLGGDTGSLSSFIEGATRSGPSRLVEQLEQEREQLAERYGPQYSKVQNLQDQIDRVQTRTRDARGRLDKVELRDLLGATEESLKTIDAMRADLRERFESDHEQAKKVEGDLLTEASLRSNLERHRSLFNTVVDQLKQAQFVSDFVSISSQVIEPANGKPTPVSPRVGLTLALALFAGALLGVGMVVASDRLDPTIRSVDELRSALGNMNVLGIIPMIDEKQSTTRYGPGLITHELPRSVCSESYRAVRTSLDFIRRNQRLHVILLSSPHSGDGKSTSASNLAISLAQTQRKVLLIDGDLRKPVQHSTHGLPNSRGLTHVLKGLLPLDRVIQQTRVRDLDLLAAGPSVPDPAELLTSPRLAELLEEARAKYDLVVIDSSPLLAVTDGAVIASIVDGVILVVRSTSLRHREADAAVSILRTSGAPVLGALVNAVSLERGGYGYGYGGVYGHRYGYANGYGNAADARGDEAEGAKGAGTPALVDHDEVPNHQPMNGTTPHPGNKAETN